MGYKYFSYFYGIAAKRALWSIYNRNNGVERQNETFKHTYLKNHHGSSLTGMLNVLIEEYFPEQYER